MKSKRGQGLSVNAIILIILGVIVLAILIVGFTIGWSKILPFIKTNNVENVRTSCNLACSTGASYDYCEISRTVNDGVAPEFKATCNALSADEFKKYGITACPSISCLASEEAITP